MRCYLCGKEISTKELTKDHIPPSQFFPRKLRPKFIELGHDIQLKTRKSCIECNQKYQEDEKYFFYKWVFFIREMNDIGKLIYPYVYDDARKDDKNSKILEKVILESKPFRYSHIVDQYGKNYKILDLKKKPSVTINSRDVNVLKKIFRGIVFIEKKIILPKSINGFLHACEPEVKPPEEIYSGVLSAAGKGTHKGIFDYKIIEDTPNNLYIIAILLWDILIFSAAFIYSPALSSDE